MLRQSAAAYGTLHSYRCQVRTELRLNGEAHGRVIQISLSYQKPSQAAVSVLKNGQRIQYICDAHTLYICSPDGKEYLKRPFSKGTPPEVFVMAQGESFVGLTLLQPAGLTALADVKTAKSLTLGPLETVGKIDVRTVTRVIARADGSSMTFRLTLGVKDHLIYNFSDTIQSAAPLVDSTGNVTQIDSSEIYSSIQADPVLPASTFLPPPGAKQITPNENTPK